MKNKIEDLRDHLFETLEALKDPDKPMDIARAKAVADVARVIVESAKVEVDYVRATGQESRTHFIPALPRDPERGTPDKPRLVNGKAGGR
jgi:hypothetical protein